MEAQRSPEWFADRLGKITASRMCDVMAMNDPAVFKSGPRKGQAKPVDQKSRTDYMRELATQRITGIAADQISAAALKWGEEVEPAARQAYQAKRGVIVRQCGFMVHPSHDFIGASPDFLVGMDGGGEIKCPYSRETHTATLLDGLPSEHIEQIQGGLWVTDRQYWDFVSFHPEFPPHSRLYIQRVQRDNDYIDKLEAACLSLEADVQAIVSKLQGTS